MLPDGLDANELREFKRRKCEGRCPECDGVMNPDLDECEECGYMDGDDDYDDLEEEDI